MSPMLRSAGAVAAGFATTFALSVLGDVVMHGLGVFPPFGEPMSDALFALATAYRTVFTVLGGYVTARRAPDRPLGHGLVLSGIGTVAGSLGVIAAWNAGPELGPMWYPVALVVEAVPCVMFGAWLGRGR